MGKSLVIYVLGKFNIDSAQFKPHGDVGEKAECCG
jgi:hypothetical protein